MNSNSPSPILPLSVQRTIEYPREQSPTPAQAGRCKMELVRGSGGHSVSAIEHLLRSRLRIASLIMTGGFTVFLIKNFIDPDHTLAMCPMERILHALTVMVQASFAILLWTRLPLCKTRLRLIELGMFGSAAALFAWVQHAWFLEGRLMGCAAGPVNELSIYHLAAFGSSLRWFSIILIYGTFIPNTWRRCAAVTGAMALTPLAITAAGMVANADLRSHLTVALIDQTLVMGMAFAIALFGSYKINELQQEANEMRQLGQYRLKQRLGSGGMGEVYLAEHMLLRRPCAVKLIRPEQAGNPANLRRFEREVQATATLTHWNTIEIYDYGHEEDGTFYYVMEYLPGESLEDLIAKQGPLPPERAVHFLRQVCGALREAHRIGLIHRDIKPSNVFATERGGIYDVAKLLDFGLVQNLDFGSPSAKLTIQGTILGSPPYMSPEQAAGKANLDGRTDIYSLGAVAYFLMTGQPPFLRDTAMQMLMAHAYEPVVPPSALRPGGIPADLEAVVLRCLEKEPAKRYPDAAGLEKALAACRSADQWTEEQAQLAWQTQREFQTSPDITDQATIAAASPAPV